MIFLRFLLDWIFNGQQFWALHGCKAFPCFFKIFFSFKFYCLKILGPFLKKGGHTSWSRERLLTKKIYIYINKINKIIDVANC